MGSGWIKFRPDLIGSATDSDSTDRIPMDGPDPFGGPVWFKPNDSNRSSARIIRHHPSWPIGRFRVIREIPHTNLRRAVFRRGERAASLRISSTWSPGGIPDTDGPSTGMTPWSSSAFFHTVSGSNGNRSPFRIGCPQRETGRDVAGRNPQAKRMEPRPKGDFSHEKNQRIFGNRSRVDHWFAVAVLPGNGRRKYRRHGNYRRRGK